MILSFACLLLSIATGIAVVWKYSGIRALTPRWAAMLVMAGAGTALGIGLGSSAFVPIATLVPSAWTASLVVEAGVLAWCIYSIARESAQAPPAPSRWNAWTLAAGAGLAITIVIATMAINEGWGNNPQGNWDAWSIWNLRARFLAAPGMAARAWSEQLGETHPEYPLLLSGAIARCWLAGSNTGAGVPMAIGYLMFLAMVSAVAGAVAILRGATSGLLAGAVVVGTPALLAEVPAQYADVPLAAYLACALVLMLLHRPLWAGLLAGLAAWTKDEGVLFCVVMLAAAAIFRRFDLPRLALGMLPVGLLTIGFKLLVAPRVTGLLGGSLASRLVDANRYSVLLSGLGRDLVALGTGWYHPAIPLAVYSAGTGIARGPASEVWFSTAVAAGTLAGYCGVVIATSAEIQWQVDTAVRRLLVQWWPLAVIAVAMWQRRAPAPAEQPSTETHRDRKSRRDRNRRER